MTARSIRRMQAPAAVPPRVATREMWACVGVVHLHRTLWDGTMAMRRDECVRCRDTCSIWTCVDIYIWSGQNLSMIAKSVCEA